MKILAIIGSPRKKSRTHEAVRLLEEKLRDLIQADFEYVCLRERKIEPCRGCFLCLERGEEFCPHKDDFPGLVCKMREADAVIVATPNYSLQVTALLKTFLDRLAYVFHRPAFFHKFWFPLVTQGVYRGKGILGYLREVGEFIGFIPVEGLALTIPPDALLSPAQTRAIEGAARRLAARLAETRSPKPGLKRLALFRLVRTLHRASGKKGYRDYEYHKERGWFTAPYYYPVRIGPGKRIIGALIDWWFGRVARGGKNGQS